MRKTIYLCTMVFVGILGLVPATAHAQTCPAGGTIYGGSLTTLHSAGRYVEGYAISYLDYAAGLCYHPSVRGDLVRTDIPEPGLAGGDANGVSSFVAAQVFLSSNNYVEGKTYCTYSAHFIIPRPNGNRILKGIWQDCKTIPFPPPTPSPTATPPTPTPTMTATPPPPTPTPTPSVIIQNIPLIEKFGEQNVEVTISGLIGNNEIVFTLKPPLAPETGEARFDNGNIEIRKGNGIFTLKIKGIVQSSSVNNMTIEATTTSSTNVLTHKEFTVAVITLLRFDIPSDPNPNVGGGLRVFPDRISPNSANQSILNVHAVVQPGGTNAQVYFASFDLDDPSATGLPIDRTNNDGHDNNGNGSVLNSSSGEFQNGQGDNCSTAVTQNNVSRIRCPILAPSDKDVYTSYKVTMQPGDNFALAASLNEVYRDTLTINPNAGENIVNLLGQTIHISGTANVNNVQGIRTDMLTVWRRLHIEVDSMGNVGPSNNIAGTITAINQYSDPNCNPPPPPSPPPCYSTLVGYDVTTSNGTPLERSRFSNGRISMGSSSFEVFTNLANRIFLKGVPAGSTKTGWLGQTFTVYDDDDFNGNDTLLDGDYVEPITRLPDSFKYLEAADGNHPDGKPRNLYANAYIRPEYNWAANAGYNQVNLQFELNVEDGVNVANLINVVNRDRGSINNERDDFWVGYILIGYQGPLLDDFDGLDPTGNFYESARLGVGPNQFIIGAEIPSCDCYDSSGCPSGGVACTLSNGALRLPKGALGSVIFQEVQQDLIKYFASPPSPIIPRALEEIKITIPHELGHQFGLLGDQKRSTFKIMDYSDYIGNVVNDEAFHPEHINIMRRRVKSPGN